MNATDLRSRFSARELNTIRTSIGYAAGRPCGLPGHNLMIIVSKLADALGIPEGDLAEAMLQAYEDESND